MTLSRLANKRDEVGVAETANSNNKINDFLYVHQVESIVQRFCSLQSTAVGVGRKTSAVCQFLNLRVQLEAFRLRTAYIKTFSCSLIHTLRVN